MNLDPVPVEQDEQIGLARSRVGETNGLACLPLCRRKQSRKSSLSHFALSSSSFLPPQLSGLIRSSMLLRESPDLPVQRKRLKPNPTKNRVSFSDQVHVTRLPVIHTIDDNHRWHSKTELRNSARAAIAALRQHAQEDETSFIHQFERILQVISQPSKEGDQSHTLSQLLRTTSLDSPARGLEPNIFPNMKEMRWHISKTILKAQSRLPAKLPPEDKTNLLRQVSVRLTKSSRQIARWMGAGDAKVVMQIVLESRACGVPKWRGRDETIATSS